MLTDAAVKNAAKRDKPYKMADSGGLYLYVATTGLKSFRMKFEMHGKQKLLTFGPYPDVKLSAAREKRDAARRMIRDGMVVRPTRKPCPDQRGLVGRVIIHDDMDIEIGRHLGVNLPEEIEELRRPVPFVAFADVEDRLFGRGIDICYETVRLW